ncbi:hypothetical protein R3P38DRAFT_3167402 [Favolaschia claudopus]|uniref:Uncharacterized protein n=1 Tax=Favolaschia claudopus TaxID=2862362 RepID=A0AAW0EEB6_9AGAR
MTKTRWKFGNKNTVLWFVISEADDAGSPASFDQQSPWLQHRATRRPGGFAAFLPTLDDPLTSPQPVLDSRSFLEVSSLQKYRIFNLQLVFCALFLNNSGNPSGATLCTLRLITRTQLVTREEVAFPVPSSQMEDLEPTSCRINLGGIGDG